MFITLTSIAKDEYKLLVNLDNVTTISPYALDTSLKFKSSISFNTGVSFYNVIETIEEIQKKIENTRLREAKQ